MFAIGFVGERKEWKGRKAVGYFSFGILGVQQTRIIRRPCKED